MNADVEVVVAVGWIRVAACLLGDIRVVVIWSGRSGELHILSVWTMSVVEHICPTVAARQTIISATVARTCTRTLYSSLYHPF